MADEAELMVNVIHSILICATDGLYVYIGFIWGTLSQI